MLSLDALRKQLAQELVNWQLFYFRPHHLLGRPITDENFQRLVTNLFPIRPLSADEQQALAVLDSAKAFLSAEAPPRDNPFYRYYHGVERPEKPRFSTYLIMQSLLLNENLNDVGPLNIERLEDSIVSLGPLSQAMSEIEAVDAKDAFDIAIEADNADMLALLLEPRLRYRLNARLEALFAKARAPESKTEILKILIEQSAKCYEHGITAAKTQRFLALIGNTNEWVTFYQSFASESRDAFFETFVLADFQRFISNPADIERLFSALTEADRLKLLDKLNTVAETLTVPQLLSLLAYQSPLARVQSLLALGPVFSSKFNALNDFYRCLELLDFRVREDEALILHYKNIYVPEALHEAFEAAKNLNQAILDAPLSAQHKLQYLLLTRELLTARVEDRGRLAQQYLAHVDKMERELNRQKDQSRSGFVVFFIKIFRFLGLISPNTLSKDAKALNQLASQDVAAFVFPLTDIVADLDEAHEAAILHAMQEKRYDVFWTGLSPEQIDGLFSNPLRLAKLFYAVGDEALQALFEGLGHEQLDYFVEHHDALVQKIQNLPAVAALALIKAIGRARQLSLIEASLVQFTAMVLQLSAEHHIILFEGLDANVKSRLAHSNEKLAPFLSGLTADKYPLLIEQLNLFSLRADLPRLAQLMSHMEAGKAVEFCACLMQGHGMSLADILSLTTQLEAGPKRLLVMNAFFVPFMEIAALNVLNDVDFAMFASIVKLLPDEGQRTMMASAKPFLTARLNSVTALHTLMLMFNHAEEGPHNRAQEVLLEFFNELEPLPIRNAAEFLQIFDQSYVQVAQRPRLIQETRLSILQPLIRDGRIDVVLRSLDDDEANKRLLLSRCREGLENIQDTEHLIAVLNGAELNALCSPPTFLKSKMGNLLALTEWLRSLPENKREIIVSCIAADALNMSVAGEQLHKIFKDMPEPMRLPFLKRFMQLSQADAGLLLTCLQSNAFRVLQGMNPNLYSEILALDARAWDGYLARHLRESRQLSRQDISDKLTALHACLGTLYQNKMINQPAAAGQAVREVAQVSLLGGLVQVNSEGLLTWGYQKVLGAERPHYATLCRQTIEWACDQIANIKKMQALHIELDAMLLGQIDADDPANQNRQNFDRVCRLSDQCLLEDQRGIQLILNSGNEALKKVKFRCNIDANHPPLSCVDSLKTLINALDEIKTDHRYMIELNALDAEAKMALVQSNDKLLPFLNGVAVDKYPQVIAKLNLSSLLGDLPRLAVLINAMDEARASEFCACLVREHAMPLANILSWATLHEAGAKRLLVTQIFLLAYLKSAHLNDADIATFASIVKLLPADLQLEVMRQAKPFLMPRLGSFPGLYALMSVFNDAEGQRNRAQETLLEFFNELVPLPIRNAAEFLQAVNQSYILVAQRPRLIQETNPIILQHMIGDGSIVVLLRHLDADEPNKRLLLERCREDFVNLQDTRLLMDKLNEAELQLLCSPPTFLKLKTANLLALLDYLRDLPEGKRELIASCIAVDALNMSVEGEPLQGILLNMPEPVRAPFLKRLMQLSPADASQLLTCLQSNEFRVLQGIDPDIASKILLLDAHARDAYISQHLRESQQGMSADIRARLAVIQEGLGELCTNKIVKVAADGHRTLGAARLCWLDGLIQVSSQNMFYSGYQVLVGHKGPDYTQLCKQTIERLCAQIDALKKIKVLYAELDKVLPVQDDEARQKFDKACQFSDQLLLKDQHRMKSILDSCDAVLKRVKFRCNMGEAHSASSCVESLKILINILDDIKTDREYHMLELPQPVAIKP